MRWGENLGDTIEENIQISGYAKPRSITRVLHPSFFHEEDPEIKIFRIKKTAVMATPSAKMLSPLLERRALGTPEYPVSVYSSIEGRFQSGRSRRKEKLF